MEPDYRQGITTKIQGMKSGLSVKCVKSEVCIAALIRKELQVFLTAGLGALPNTELRETKTGRGSGENEDQSTNHNTPSARINRSK